MRLRILAASCVLTLFAAAVCLAQESRDATVTFVGDPWTPWVYGTEGSVPDKGIAVEIIREIFKRLDGYKPSFMLYPWNRCLDLVREGEADALILCAYNAERAGYAAYTDEILRNKAVLLFRKGAPPKWASLGDFNTYRIGILADNDYGTIFDRAARDHGYSVNDSARTIDQALVLLQDKKVDIILTTETVVAEIYKSNPRNKDRFEATGSPFSDGDIYSIAFSRKSGRAKLIPRINTIIAQIKAEGIIDKIRSKYLGK